MRLWRPSDVEPLLAELDLKPSRALGQNFLVDGNILGLIIEEAGLGPEDVILEIGAGLGVLTAPLLHQARRVVAIEKDPVLWRHLQRSFGEEAKLDLVHADALDLDLSALLVREGVTRVVANLPYSVAARLLVDLAIAEARPSRMVVTVQKEVGDRLAASPGQRDFGVTSVLIQRVYAVGLCRTISPACFLPRPKVTSALVRLDRRPAPLGEPSDPETFRRLVRHAFSQRRKQMLNVLQHAPPGLGGSREDAAKVLAGAGINPRARPGELGAEAWVELANEISA